MFIRPAEPKDVNGMIAMLNREIRESVNIFRIEPLNSEMTERWWQLHGHGRFRAVVAEESADAASGHARLAGWASLAPFSAYEGYHRTAELAVWVDASMRRRGCGRLLVEALQASCKERNIRTVISRIEANNQASLKLHLACGFKQVGLLEDVGEKFGRSLSVVLMQYHVAGQLA